jgi:serine/threonine protein kinase
MVVMTDEGHAPTIPDTQAPTHGPSGTGIPKPPDARYALRALLGKGGMGEVWLAHDTRIDRDIAVKLMRGSKDADAVARFLREARVQGRLEHPSVVPVHDLGGDETAPFFAMKRLIGITLADVIASHGDTKWPRRTLLTRFVEICLAIEFAHNRGVIHRDLKPANIMLEPSPGPIERGVLIDFGFATFEGSAKLTLQGTVVGSLTYIAPERLRAEEPDRRADIYALGVVLFELLTGHPPFQADDDFDLIGMHLNEDPPSVGPDAPTAGPLDPVIARALAKASADRYDDAAQMADAVERAAQQLTE